MIEKVARNQPAAYMKICALLVPREMKVEHSGGVKAMSDEQLEAAIELIKSMLEARSGANTKVIEGTPETVAFRRLILSRTTRQSDKTKSWMRQTPRSERGSASRGSACHHQRAADLTM